MNESHSIVAAEPNQATLHTDLAQWRSETALWEDENKL